MVKENSQIFSPKDFGGKRVGIFKGYDTEIIYNWMISQYPPERPPIPKELNPSVDGVSMLENDQIDVLPAYAINEPLEAASRKKPLKVRLIYPDYFNLGYYSDTLIANQDALQRDPDIAQRFWKQAKGVGDGLSKILPMR